MAKTKEKKLTRSEANVLVLKEYPSIIQAMINQELFPDLSDAARDFLEKLGPKIRAYKQPHYTMYVPKKGQDVYEYLAKTTIKSLL